MKTPILALIAAAVLAAAPPSASADEFAPPAPPRPDAAGPTLPEILAGIGEGALLRVRLADGREMVGRHAGVASGRIFLAADAGTLPLPLDDIENLWLRGRATRTGVSHGAWIVGIGAGIYGALIGAYVDALDGSGTSGAGGAVVGGAFGAALGAVAGGLTGGVIGSAFPEWRQVWGEGVESAPPEEPIAPEPWPDARRTGALTFGAGIVHARGDGGLAAHASLTSPLAGGFRHGAEFLVAGSTAPRRDPLQEPGSDLADLLLAAGWRLEWTPGDSHAPGVAPVLIGGAGAYFWEDTYLGVNAGIGLRWRDADRRLAASLEVRRHLNLQRLVETDPDVTTAVLGISFNW